MNPFARNFFTRDVLEVAPGLLGSYIILGTSPHEKYLITEVEAYKGEDDLACHASKGRTKRTEVMYWEGGYIYVYLIYGVHWMLNIVTGPVNEPQAVLIRSIEQCKGPGRVGRLLGIDKSYYGVDVVNSKRLWLEPGPANIEHRIEQSTRVGIDYAGAYWQNKNWRYMLSV